MSPKWAFWMTFVIMYLVEKKCALALKDLIPLHSFLRRLVNRIESLDMKTIVYSVTRIHETKNFSNTESLCNYCPF